MPDVIAILEDDDRRRAAMTAAFLARFLAAEVVFFNNAPDMVAWLAQNLPSARLLCLDHDLGPNHMRNGQEFDPGTGRDVVDFLTTSKRPSCPVLIHSSNVEGADGMQFALEDAGWTVGRVSPVDDLAWIGSQWAEHVAAFMR